MDFAKTIQEIQALRVALTRRNDAIRKVEEKILGLLKSLDNVCRPICIKAVQGYNVSTSLRIVLLNFGITFDLDKKKILLSALLAYPSGNEPDENLDETDVECIESALGTILDRELKAAGIPFTFSSLTVPHEYFGK